MAFSANIDFLYTLFYSTPVNLSKLSAVLVTCVAVTLSMSACTLPDGIRKFEPKPEPSASAAPTETYDEWVNWTAGTKTEMPVEYKESVRAFSEQLDLGVVFEQPADTYIDQGWVGVAQYGSLCIIAFGIDEQSTADGSVMLTVLSRYDISMTVATNWSDDYDQIRTDLTDYTRWCETGGPIPLPAEGGDISLQEQPVTA